jgi:imidazolonepropionase-like amidohydrolase
VLARLATDGAVLVPTLARIDWLIESAELAGASEAQLDALLEARELAHASARAAVAAGVRIAFGTDATVLPHGSNAREFRALVEIGLPPPAALRAATLHAAELLGWSDRVGTLEPGKLADAIAVRGNPLEDIGALERVAFVLRGGAVVVAPR